MNPQPSSIPIEVLYEDNHLLVVVKPAGLLSQGDASGCVSMLDLARERIRERKGKTGNVFIGLVHRLDRPVEGVMVFAKTSKAAARLSEQFRDHRVNKQYEAVVEGVPSEHEGRLRDHLLKTHQHKQVKVASPNQPGSREAILEYVVAAHERGFALVRIRLLTGRSHQVRVQLGSRGWPVLGDRKYGSRYELPGRVIALRAASLGFVHPTRGDEMAIEAPGPAWWPWPPPEGLHLGHGARTGRT